MYSLLASCESFSLLSFCSAMGKENLFCCLLSSKYSPQLPHVIHSYELLYCAMMIILDRDNYNILHTHTSFSDHLGVWDSPKGLHHHITTLGRL